MPMKPETQLRVAHADIVFDIGFSRSLRHWHLGNEGSEKWTVLPGECGSILLGEDDSVVIDGDYSNEVEAHKSATINVCGDLLGRIVVGDHCEIIVEGDIGPEAVIRCSEIGSIYVGGSNYGKIESARFVYIWMEGDFAGVIETGEPWTFIHIGGDLLGSFSVGAPAQSGLNLEVAGFASHESVMKIAEANYLEFEASIGKSDVPPGIYPKEGDVKFKRSNRWCVLA